MDLQYKIFVGPYKIFTALLLLNRMSWWHFDTQTKISILKTCHVVRVCVCVWKNGTHNNSKDTMYKSAQIYLKDKKVL